jgi:hypothetical protein
MTVALVVRIYQMSMKLYKNKTHMIYKKMFKEVNVMRKKMSLLYVFNTTTDLNKCGNYQRDYNDNADDYDDVNTYLFKYDDTQYCVDGAAAAAATVYSNKWDAN